MTQLELGYLSLSAPRGFEFWLLCCHFSAQNISAQNDELELDFLAQNISRARLD
jgi:hypothetical protein